MRRIDLIGRRRVYDGFCKLDVIELRYEARDGSMSEPIKREVIERGDAVGALVRKDENFLFVRQLRPPMIRHEEPWLVEIVAGVIDEGESAEESARREVEEEIGYRVRSLEPLGVMYGSPGALSERVDLYFADVSGEEPVGEGGGVDEHEDVELVSIAIEEAFEMLDRGEIRDAKTQIALMHWRWKSSSQGT
ncbi:NUDIX domain-containing protein [Fimbriimonas ginsengisoli]|uniref:ADP-ribose pyrophosphatase n=1 Tax=Fimbriimonas ginsengisoli Gsoil 348 TaxID=661478 RepID=A0A068NUY3_FIMGI|nr:NUDIX hydrolase [Fimbriimonas ginsengisoli]AIE87167.1 ADP-ribose pyrophosphatase [Fimbriimonas ginsengisoli Gsoil 348]